MRRDEALRLLGLDETATDSDIKTAYKEMVQILHPDRFASSKKLQDRATEQFKNLQEAYDLLTKTSSRSQGKTAYSKSNSAQNYTNAEAKLAGLMAARTQLVAQRDVLFDERRNGLIIAGIGIVIGIFLRRIPIALALGAAAIIWGLIRVILVQATINTINDHIKKINAEHAKIVKDMEIEPNECE